MSTQHDDAVLDDESLDQNITLENGEDNEEILEDEENLEESLEEDHAIPSIPEEEPDFFAEEETKAASFLNDENMNPYLTDEMTDFLNDRITDYSAIGKNAGKQNITSGKNLNKVRGISISIAKKEDIMAQSHGEILISETINYRTQRPER